ncbi:MAG: VOC family protein [Nitrospirae bacterium]|nr:VOC family protein [Nitrospirota bacterium]
MGYEFDHLFVCTAVGAPEAEHLITFGLTEGASNVHPGQGTANRRFFFHNAMLELLWVHDAAEAQSEPVGRTQLWERWSGWNSKASPFGICVRPADPRSTDVPFPAWEYRPPYLRDSLVIYVGEDTPIAEPLWFYMDVVRRADSQQVEKRQPLTHPIGFPEVTGVRLTSLSVQPLSGVAQTVLRSGVVSVRPGSEHLLEVMFDGSRHWRSADFRPFLPLVFH